MQITIDIDDAWVQEETNRLIREALSGAIKKAVGHELLMSERSYSRDIPNMVSKAWNDACQDAVNRAVSNVEDIEELAQQALERKVKAKADAQYKLIKETK